jgi:hypothetical protein
VFRLQLITWPIFCDRYARIPQSVMGVPFSSHGFASLIKTIGCTPLSGFFKVSESPSLA